MYAQPEKSFHLCMKADLIQLKLEDDTQLSNLDVRKFLGIQEAVRVG